MDNMVGRVRFWELRLAPPVRNSHLGVFGDLLTVGKELAEEILGEDAHVALDLVVEHQTRRHRRLILAAPPPPPPCICHSARYRHGARGDVLPPSLAAESGRRGSWDRRVVEARL